MIEEQEELLIKWHITLQEKVLKINRKSATL